MKPVSDETRKEDERLRKELENVDLEKLKEAIKPLLHVKPSGPQLKSTKKSNSP
jgi:hypothetical protein